MLSLTRYLLLLLPFSTYAATDDLLFGLGLRQGGSAAAQVYTANAVDFDGANDSARKTTALTGLADSKVVTFSIWFRIDAGDGAELRLLTWANGSAAGRFRVRRTTGNDIDLLAQNSSGTSILVADTATTLTAGAAWHHFACAIDLANSSNRACYLDGTAESMTWTTYTDDTIDLDPGTYRYTVGGNGNATPAQLWDGCMSEVWFNDEYFAITATTFRSASGKPISLGSDGSGPTGNQPVVYLKTASPDWETNSGSGGNFTENGTLDACSTSPSS